MADELKLVCPECGFIADKTMELPWGDANQTLPVAPYICAGCGAASIINLLTRKVKAVPPAGWLLVKESNPALWAAICEAQEKIRTYRAWQKRTGGQSA